MLLAPDGPAIDKGIAAPATSFHFFKASNLPDGDTDRDGSLRLGLASVREQTGQHCRLFTFCAPDLRQSRSCLPTLAALHLLPSTSKRINTVLFFTKNMPPKRKRNSEHSTNGNGVAVNGGPLVPPDRETWTGWVEMESEPVCVLSLTPIFELTLDRHSSTSC